MKLDVLVGEVKYIVDKLRFVVLWKQLHGEISDGDKYLADMIERQIPSE
jgi:hypothetical protein